MDGTKNHKQLKEQNANSLLHSSVIKGNKSTFLEALKLGCNLRSLSKYGDPPLVGAAGVDPYTSHDSKSGKDRILDILELLLEHDVDINGRGAGGETALHRAVTVRAQNRMKYLLEKGCDVDIRDSRGQTALFGATVFVEGLELLLRYEPLLDVYDVDGYTPLHYVMMSESPNSLETLKMLIDSGCDINSLSSRDRKSSLMVTLRADGQLPRSDQRVEKTLLLLANGIDVNAQDSHGKTTLHYAVISQCVELIKVLLKNKAGLEIKDKKGLTVQEAAKLSSNPQVIRLVERAVDKSSRLLPYEDALINLESLYESIGEDAEVPNSKKIFIRNQITELESSMQELISSGRGADLMAIEHKRKLLQKHSVLCEEMMPHFVLKSLQADKVLSEEDIQAISAEKSRKLMCVKLLELIVHRGSRAYPSLLRALHNSKQAHVCMILCEEGEEVQQADG